MAPEQPPDLAERRRQLRMIADCLQTVAVMERILTASAGQLRGEKLASDLVRNEGNEMWEARGALDRLESDLDEKRELMGELAELLDALYAKWCGKTAGGDTVRDRQLRLIADNRQMAAALARGTERSTAALGGNTQMKEFAKDMWALAAWHEEMEADMERVDQFPPEIDGRLRELHEDLRQRMDYLDRARWNIRP